jgi:lysophospholipase L1-like esterase
MLENDNEATVDGVHFNDLGFMRYANNIIKSLESFNLL